MEYRKVVGAEHESATLLNNRELRSSKMVEAARIEPEAGAPVSTADMGKKGAKTLQLKGLRGSAGVSKKQKAEEVTHLSGIDPNKIYAICMQQPELAQVALAWEGLTAEERARILAIVDETESG